MEKILNTRSDKNEIVKSLLLSNSSDDINLLLETIWNQRPLVFTLPISDINSEIMDDRNYSIKNYKNFILGIRNDFKVIGANFDNIFNAISSNIANSSLDEYISSLLESDNISNSPFSKKDELDILDSLF